MSAPFYKACQDGNEEQAEELYDRDQSVLNEQSIAGNTALMAALMSGQHTIARWLLSLSQIDVNIKAQGNYTALELAASFKTPLDILIILANPTTLSDGWISTTLSAIDLAEQSGQGNIALYLTWLGVELKENNEPNDYRMITLATWLEAGYLEDAQYWAVAANDVKSLITLKEEKNVTLNREKLLFLVKIFDRREIQLYLEGNPFLKIYYDQTFADFEIDCQGVKFPCHKSIIGGRSEVFKATIESKARLNLENTTDLQNCQDVSVAELFIKFFYMCDIERNLTDCHLVLLLHLSDFYQVDDLKKKVEEEMISRLGRGTVKEFLIASDMYKGDRVKKAALMFLTENRGVWRENQEDWMPAISRALLCELVTKLA